VGEGSRTDHGSSPHIPCGSPTPWVSPHVSSYALPESIKVDVGGLHPLPEGRGQVVATSFGPKRNKRVSIHMARGLKMNSLPFNASCRAHWLERDVVGVVESEINRVDLDSNSEKKTVGKPPTHARGTGSQRVNKVQPAPLPGCTLPVTRVGFQTRDNPIQWRWHAKHNNKNTRLMWWGGGECGDDDVRDADAVIRGFVAIANAWSGSCSVARVRTRSYLVSRGEAQSFRVDRCRNWARATKFSVGVMF